LYVGAPADWRPVVADATGMNMPSAAAGLLTYPHAWVRLAASRVLGLFLSRRRVEGFAAAAVAAAEEEAAEGDGESDGCGEEEDEEVDAKGNEAGGDEEEEEEAEDGDEEAEEAADAALADAVAALDGAAVWMANERILSAVALRVVAQLSSRHLATPLAEPVAKNLVFLTLALHANVPEGRRNAVNATVQGGADADAAAAAGGAPAAASMEVDSAAAAAAVDEGDDEVEEGEEEVDAGGAGGAAGAAPSAAASSSSTAPPPPPAPPRRPRVRTPSLRAPATWRASA
jgi:hypothetical protein